MKKSINYYNVTRPNDSLIFIQFFRVYTLLSFFTMTLNSSNLGGNVYINNLIGGGFDVLAAIAITVILKKFCRRHTMVFLLAMFGSFSILSQLVKQGEQSVLIVTCGNGFLGLEIKSKSRGSSRLTE